MKVSLKTLLLYLLATGWLPAAPLYLANKRDTTQKEKIPVSYQDKKIMFFDNGVRFANNFAGARLNDLTQVNDSVFRVTIAPENQPINKSPWYAFKVWSLERRNIYVKLHYTYATHRYHPKLSTDGRHWKNMDKASIATDAETEDAILRLETGSDTLWVAAQELISSSAVWQWADSLAAESNAIQKSIIGYSILNRPIASYRIGNKKNARVLVVLSRQHPPEITGYQAMQAFTERILARSKLSSAFRKKFDVLVMPALNPDGIDLGHWRHNAGGVDLNRDWDKFQQPETRAVSHYLKECAAKGDSLWFCLDFHSTQEDVFYIVTQEKHSLTQAWLAAIQRAMPEYKVNQSFHGVESATSKNWIYKQFGAEDDTDRALLKTIGETAADELMRALLTRTSRRKK
jgi:cytosolic carboxypeptidase protein 6